LSLFIPDFLIVICRFYYESRGSRRYVPNEERRYLCGRRITGRRGLPEKVKEKSGEDLFPIYFALIKEPMKIGGRIFNAATGAIIVYRLDVTERKAYEKLKTIVINELKKRYNENFRLIIGKGEECEVGGS